MIILGIDTALRNTGYAILDCDKDITVLDCGILRNKPKLIHSECLIRIFFGIEELLEKYEIKEAAIENAFFAKNIKTTMILSYARGTIITALTKYDIPVYGYSPKEVKKITGNGTATKGNVANIIGAMLNMDVSTLGNDETDAMAIALHHYNTITQPSRVPRMRV